MIAPSTPCVLPWINFCTNTFGRARPCGYSALKSQGKVQDSSITEQFNDEVFRSVRRDFLAGKWPANCERCRFMEEARPGHSKKSRNDFHYPVSKELIEATEPDGTVRNFPRAIDIRLGTVCNLKCIHCGTGNSNKWLEDKELLGKYQNTGFVETDNSWVDRHNSMWQEIYDHLPEIKKYNFIGGEPFASVQHNRFVEHVSQMPFAGEIDLNYVTNGLLLSEKMWNILKRFGFVTISVSLDMSGRMLEFFRYPTSASALEEKLKFFESSWSKGFKLSLQWTSSNISLFYLPSTLDYYERTLTKGLIDFRFGNYVDYPAHMSAQNLPKTLKQVIRDRISPYIARYPEAEIYLKQMDEKDLWPEHGATLISYLNDLSLVRGMNWRESFSELAEHIDAG